MLKFVIYLVTPAGYDYLTAHKQKMEYALSDRDVNLLIMKASKKYEEEIKEFCYNNSCKDDTLIISDSNDIVQTLKQQGFLTAGFYHNENRDETFYDVLYAVTDVDELNRKSYDEVYRRLRQIPWDILETDRLFVRESTVEDVTDFYRIYSDPSITKYMEDLFQDPEQEIAYMQDYIKQMYGFYGFGMWTVMEKQSGEIIGRAGLSVREGYDVPELGFVIAKEHQGMGYAKEVCEAILKYAKCELYFEEVQALVIKENEASLKLLHKLGFVYEKDVVEGGQRYCLMIKKSGEVNKRGI